ncbi:hypothetical protein AAF712_015869 [Marasmius tenuissimus]|uniref:C2H2-type domain-containing protein n=1 Tax=Marasmius tenuissimus TaxID=585030 RepID=A0ABR2Z891_9AGAR
MPSSKLVSCNYCDRDFRARERLNNHIANSPKCQKLHKTWLKELWHSVAISFHVPEGIADTAATFPESVNSHYPTDNHQAFDTSIETPVLYYHPNLALLNNPEPMDEDESPAIHDMRTSVVEVPDEDLLDPYVQDSPHQAGLCVSSGKTQFHQVDEEIFLKGDNVFGPFRDKEEWELAKWLIKNVGHNQAEALNGGGKYR